MKQKSFDLHKLYKEETDWESKSTANLNYFSSSEQNSSPKGRGSSRWSITPRPRPLVKVCSQVPSWISEPLGFGYSYQTPPLSPAFLSLLSLSLFFKGRVFHSHAISDSCCVGRRLGSFKFPDLQIMRNSVWDTTSKVFHLYWDLIEMTKFEPEYCNGMDIFNVLGVCKNILHVGVNVIYDLSGD